MVGREMLLCSGLNRVKKNVTASIIDREPWYTCVYLTPFACRLLRCTWLFSRTSPESAVFLLSYIIPSNTEVLLLCPLSKSARLTIPRQLPFSPSCLRTRIFTTSTRGLAAPPGNSFGRRRNYTKWYMISFFLFMNSSREVLMRHAVGMEYSHQPLLVQIPNMSRNLIR